MFVGSVLGNKNIMHSVMDPDPGKIVPDPSSSGSEMKLK
jgi:hypothetical protein